MEIFFIYTKLFKSFIFFFSFFHLTILPALQKQLFDEKNENKRLEKQFLIKQSQTSKIEDLKDREDKLIQENQDYRSQIALLSDQVMLQNSKTFDLENSIKELRNSINEREEVKKYYFL